MALNSGSYLAVPFLHLTLLFCSPQNLCAGTWPEDACGCVGHFMSETQSYTAPLSAACGISDISLQPCLAFLAKDTKMFNARFDGSRSLA